MRGQPQATSLQGRAVSFFGTSVLSACLIGMPLSAFAQAAPDSDRKFSAESDAIIDTAFDLAAEDNVSGAIKVLDDLASQPGLSAYERSSVSHMIGAFHYDAGHLYEAKIAFDAAVAAGGLSGDEIAKMKPTLSNINALDKLGLLKPKTETSNSEPKSPEPEFSEPKAEVEPQSTPSQNVIVKAEPVPDETPASALLMASTAPAESLSSIVGEQPESIVPEIESSPIDPSPVEAADSDHDAQPTKRPPPKFPSIFLRGDNSGYCDVKFDVNTEGSPINVKATNCTSVFLEGPTIKSVEKWTYDPKIVNGSAVMRNGVESTIRFDLQDEDGEILPLPDGY